MNTSEVIQNVMVAIAVLIAGGAFRFAWSANTQLVAMDVKMAQIQKDITALSNNTATDIHQSETLSKHWRLHGWERDQFAEIWRKTDMPYKQWPDLSP